MKKEQTNNLLHVTIPKLRTNKQKPPFFYSAIFSSLDMMHKHEVLSPTFL